MTSARSKRFDGRAALGEFEAFYREARVKFDSDSAFADRARGFVSSLLQSGDEETLRLWGILVDESVRAFGEIFARLGVLLAPEDIFGESFYNPMLADVVTDLISTAPACSSKATAPSASSRQASPIVRTNRCRSSCKSPTGATPTPRPTSRPCVTGSMPRHARSIVYSSAHRSPNISRWSSLWRTHGRPAGFRMTLRRCT